MLCDAVVACTLPINAIKSESKLSKRSKKHKNNKKSQPDL